MFVYLPWCYFQEAKLQNANFWFEIATKRHGISIACYVKIEIQVDRGTSLIKSVLHPIHA